MTKFSSTKKKLRSSCTNNEHMQHHRLSNFHSFASSVTEETNNPLSYRHEIMASRRCENSFSSSVKTLKASNKRCENSFSSSVKTLKASNTQNRRRLTSVLPVDLDESIADLSIFEPNIDLCCSPLDYDSCDFSTKEILPAFENGKHQIMEKTCRRQEWANMKGVSTTPNYTKNVEDNGKIHQQGSALTAQNIDTNNKTLALTLVKKLSPTSINKPKVPDVFASDIAAAAVFSAFSNFKFKSRRKNRHVKTSKGTDANSSPRSKLSSGTDKLDYHRSLSDKNLMGSSKKLGIIRRQSSDIEAWARSSGTAIGRRDLSPKRRIQSQFFNEKSFENSSNLLVNAKTKVLDTAVHRTSNKQGLGSNDEDIPCSKQCFPTSRQRIKDQSTEEELLSDIANITQKDAGLQNFDAEEEEDLRKKLKRLIIISDRAFLEHDTGVEVWNSIANKDNDGIRLSSLSKVITKDRTSPKLEKVSQEWVQMYNETFASTDMPSQCVICSNGERAYVAMPCVHFSFCADCVTTLNNKNCFDETSKSESLGVACPICKEPDVTFSKVFF